MSFIDPPDSTIWNMPNQDPSNVDTWTDDPNLVDGTDVPVQVGGVGNTWATTTAPAGTPAQVVLSGENNTLSVGFGPAEIQSIGGGGNIIESVQVLGDGTKIISTGNFGQGGAAFNATVDEDAEVTGNVIGETSTISKMAGGLSPAGGLYSYAVGGTGNDQLYGSSFSDFLRGGAGDDTIYAFGGNDIVRGGAGSDLITLGTGKDTLYYTADQLQDGDTDFNAHEGETDILAIQADRVGGTGNYGSFGGFGTDSLSITDIDNSITTVVAQAGYQWKTDDIFFVV
jgi:Ca2+-binding RTX toxin-like protein